MEFLMKLNTTQTLTIQIKIRKDKYKNTAKDLVIGVVTKKEHLRKFVIFLKGL